jgi:signal transduction histidine kinase
LKIDFEIEDGRKIEFNETKLQRVCDNNISNAIKYSFENSTIFIKLYKEADKVVFYIENHGEKIKDKEKLFDRFYREDEARGGFGLGLNIVKDICEENQVDIKTIFEEGKNIFIYTFKGIT